MKKLNVGIVGCGAVARKRHAPSYKLDGRCKIVAVLSPDLEQAKSFAQKFRIPKFYNDMNDFLSEKLDIVSICTPPPTHCDLAIQCMKQGWHVLVEKPMAMNISEAKRMLDESRKQGVKLCVSHNLLFSHSIRYLSKLEKRGKLGRVRSIWGIQISNLKRELPSWYPTLPGGLFFDEAPHMLYLFRSFLPNLEIRDVIVDHKLISKQKPGRIEVYFTEEKIRSANLLMDFGCSRDEWFLYLIFEKAFVNVDLFRDTFIILGEAGTHNPLDVLKGSISEILQKIIQLSKAGIRFSLNRQFYGHDKLIQLFINSVMNDAEPPVKAEDGMSIVKIQEDILKKASLLS